MAILKPLRIRPLGMSFDQLPKIPSMTWCQDSAFDGIMVLQPVKSTELINLLALPGKALVPVADFTGRFKERADYSSTTMNPRTILAAIDSFRAMIQKVDELQDFHGELAPLLYTLALAMTRKQSIMAQWDADSHESVSYPLLLGLNIKREDLEHLAKLGLLQHEAFEVAVQCAKCGSGDLVIEEVCSKCRSSNLMERPMILHTICGHREPSPAFQVKGKAEMECPVCGQVLKQENLDYQKEGVVLICADCNTVMEDEPAQSYLCLSCDHSTPIDAGEQESWYHYHPTKAAIDVVRNGKLPSL